MTYKVIHQDVNGVTLYGGARDFWQSKHHEIILSGPFETGKTFAVLYKFHNLLIKYPNSQALMVRQVYNDLVKSAIATYENKVLPVPPDHPDSFVKCYGGERPTKYVYANGSEIIVAGLDRSESVLSSEFDFIYVNQAEEIPRKTWETLIGRATGRAGNAPYSQIMGECNPSFPSHWILSRHLAGHLKMFEQLHKHNPTLYDQETGKITAQGELSMKALNSLTGINYQRGVLGQWVAAEGIIYDNFSLSVNVTEEAEYNPDYPVNWGCDDGHAQGEGVGTAGYHPRAIVLANILPGGVVHIFYEYHETLTLAEQSIKELLERPYKPPELAMVDSSAKDLRMRLTNANIPNGAATHKVKDGIDNMRHFIKDGHGVTRLFIHPRCVNFIREIQSYRYNDRATKEETPLKVDDHVMDATRYLLWNYR